MKLFKTVIEKDVDKFGNVTSEPNLVFTRGALIIMITVCAAILAVAVGVAV